MLRQRADTASPQGIDAAFELAERLTSGNGMARDVRRAAQYYRTAAEGGVPSAQLRLGQSYADGVGVPQDFELAYFWLNLGIAGAGGTEQVAARRMRDSLFPRLTNEQVAALQQRARDWSPRFAQFQALTQ